MFLNPNKEAPNAILLIELSALWNPSILSEFGPRDSKPYNQASFRTDTDIFLICLVIYHCLSAN